MVVDDQSRESVKNIDYGHIAVSRVIDLDYFIGQIKIGEDDRKCPEVDITRRYKVMAILKNHNFMLTEEKLS